MALIEAGIDYCVVHHGIREADMDDCDFAAHDDLECVFAPLLYESREAQN